MNADSLFAVYYDTFTTFSATFSTLDYNEDIGRLGDIRCLACYPMHPKLVLERWQLEPKKSLGQNFLCDENVLAHIAAAAELELGDNVLEIGPGLGGLTQHLARAAGRVVAVELDDRLIPILHKELDGRTNVEVVHGDILAHDPATWFDNAPYKVVANVPYYITGAILRHLLGSRHKPALMVLTVQQEVAERLTARPGQMSLLAVSVQFYGRPVIVGRIKAGAFWPSPAVDSAVVRIDCRGGPAVQVDDEEAFFAIVRAGFSQKRKQLKNNLANQRVALQAAEVELALARAGVDGRRRAETLSLAEWAAVYRSLMQPTALVGDAHQSGVARPPLNVI
ncbi:MAG: 16S rRNA (adenine(1518)-N(6)/adenine(1519)-N(6))-dimethyltransferase RsmA [Chloroflexota bacterium]